MNKNTVVNFKKPSEFLPDSSTDVLRAGARELLATAVRAEVSEFPACHVQLMEDECHQRFVRHSFLRVPEVLTGIGKVAIIELRACSRTVGYFTPVHKRGTKWDNIEEHILTSLKQAPLIGFMSLAQRRAA